ncbi:alpha/beta hydrolase [Nocardioides sp. CER19]|uniref:alpha/beta fold hydrolase n=1 Tax=Nocardioides sp. CER19 TaxID=3038538 RepID=UPI0024498E5E|nr:alpha/beta hydrolase [Nocardioides sp. CER19]MDH2414419.1 alpha/beta hydrolase [Nocardioides sp. CER19]
MNRGHTRPRRTRGLLLAAAVLLTGLLVVPSPDASAGRPVEPTDRPTIVLVHGAWADGSSWSGVVRGLQHDGYRTVAFANPLRSLSGDAAYLRQYLATVPGPVVLVGHSYGAAVISDAATGNAEVRGLVFVNGSLPDRGETVAAQAGPDSALSVPDPTTIFDFVPGTLPPGPDADVYLKRSTFLTSFATGLSPAEAEASAALQRPITLGALNEPAASPAWHSIRSWYLIGTQDRVIPASAQTRMAQRAGSTVSTFAAGHLGLVTDPHAVVRVIERAVRSTTH